MRIISSVHTTRLCVEADKFHSPSLGQPTIQWKTLFVRKWLTSSEKPNMEEGKTPTGSVNARRLRDMLSNSLPMTMAVSFTIVAITAVHAMAGLGSQDLHTMMEIVSTLLALMVGVLSCVRYFSKKNVAYLCLASGFIGVAVLDGYHAVVTSSQFCCFMLSPPASLTPWSWHASRTFLAIWMVLTWLATTNKRTQDSERFRELAVWITGATVTVLSIVVCTWLPLPRALFPDWFFSRPQELLPGALFALAFFGFNARKDEETNSFLGWLHWSLVVGFTVQVVVMSRSTLLYDLPFNLAHLLKVFSYTLVLGGLLDDVYRTFRRGEQSRVVLEQLADKLKHSEGRFGRAVAGSSDGLWDYQIATGQVWYSDRFTRLLGFETEEADSFEHVFESWASRLHAEDRDGVLAAIESHLSNGWLYDVKCRLQMKSGEYRWFRARGQAEWDRHGTAIRMAGSLTDIHDQRTVEERLDLAIRAANEGLWDWEINSGATYFNDTFYTMLGYHPGEFPMNLQTWEALVHADDAPSAKAKMEEHLSGQSQSYRHEHRLLRKDGSWHWILGIGEVVEWDADGRPSRMIGVHVDIQNLKEISTRLELAHTSANAGIWDWNVAANTFVSNPTFHTMIGEEPLSGDIPMEYFLSRLHPTEVATIQREIDAAQASDVRTYDVEFRFRCADASYKWIRSTGRVIERCPEGRPLRMIGQHIDVTQQKQLESSLRESRNMADTVNQDLVGINIIQHVLFTCRTEQDVGETITNVLVEKFGAHFAGLWLKPTDGCEPSGADEFPLLIANSWDTENVNRPQTSRAPSVAEIERIAPGLGKSIVDDLFDVQNRFDDQWLQSHQLKSFAGFPLTLQGVVIGFVASFSREALPPHRLETLELLAQMSAVAVRNVQQIADLWTARRAAEQASLAKSEFLANMSHEIRTPMTAILGYADILADENNSDAAINREDAVETIRNNGQHLLNIINDVLDMSKIEAGRMTVEKISTNPAVILQEVKALMEPRAAGKGLKLEVSSQGLIPHHIDSDPTRLRQILLNLVGNAIKFTEIGTIKIVASIEEAEGSDPTMRFAVTDTGVGMSAEQCEKIRRFDAFTQADGSTTREFGGSGLGLRISNALARLLGGEIRIDSEQGLGSTFSVSISVGDISHFDGIAIGVADSLPPTKRDATEPAEERELPLEGMRVLLVEDGPDNQRLFCFLLKKAGADVEVAGNGRICLERVADANERNEPFDVILMDMQMPEMDGYQATRHLRDSDHKGPILALTAHAMPDDRQKCIDAGCSEFLTKPIDRAQLIEICRHTVATTVE